MAIKHTDPSEIIPCPMPTNKKFQNLTGKIFGRLTVLALKGKRPPSPSCGGFRYYWECLCLCGKTTIGLGSDLKTGQTISCGCWRGRNTFKHGLIKTPEYIVWAGMKSRCDDPNHKSWNYYGGRGITVCDRWRNFLAFLSDMGPRPSPNHSIERRDNSVCYCPENCYWETHKNQMRNTRLNRFLSLNGETKCISEWSEQMGFSHGLINGRLRRGWTIERAITTPAHK